MIKEKLETQRPETKSIHNNENSIQLLFVKKDILSDIILGSDVISKISDDLNLCRDSVEDSIINLFKRELMIDKGSLTHLFNALQTSILRHLQYALMLT